MSHVISTHRPDDPRQTAVSDFYVWRRRRSNTVLQQYVPNIITIQYDLFSRVWISELERSRITVEEVKPLLHDEVKFHNENCTIRFNDDDDDEETDTHFCRQSHQKDFSQENSTNNHNTKPIIRTTNMSPGEIFSSILDKYDTNSGGCL